MISKSSPDFIARSLLGVNVNTRIVESENPADIRLESSHILTVVTLKIKYIKCVIQSFMHDFFLDKLKNIEEYVHRTQMSGRGLS